MATVSTRRGYSKFAGFHGKVRKHLHEALRFGRERNLWRSVAAMARVIGVNQRTLWHYMRYNVGCSNRTIEKYATFCGVRVPARYRISDNVRSLTTAERKRKTG